MCGCPGMSGIKVQEKLWRAGVYVPIVFVTGHGDVAMGRGARMKGQVQIDFLDQTLPKPGSTRCDFRGPGTG